MERLDLNKAKEVAKREDWDHRLKQYDKEADDGAGPSDITQASVNKFEALNIGNDPWDKFSIKEVHHELEDETDLIEGEPGESEVRSEMGSTEDLYEQAGAVEGRVQGGELSKNAKYTLDGLPHDVKELGDRTTLVDLSFIGPVTDRKRVAGIIERVIKIYSSIPGTVQAGPSGKRGVFRFHVTNQYLSPVRAWSQSPSPDRKRLAGCDTACDLNQRSQLIPELENGIILSPKFSGLPKCVLKYGQHGLTPELISKVQTEHPDCTLNQVLKHSLSQTKKGKKVINMYRLPN
uniref:Uncharacterized protein n=1 Tax=Lepidopteran rhabdo-related virus OKIAV12 TaxID=2746297 RepID=A0A7D7F1H2_9RHAB|nr:hypothetical protein [Lepidopteran rhabdo-related virus OKIAV12]